MLFHGVNYSAKSSKSSAKKIQASVVGYSGILESCQRQRTYGGTVQRMKLLNLEGRSCAVVKWVRIIMVNWFVLRVRMDSEERVLSMLKTRIDKGVLENRWADGVYTSFIPKKIHPYVKGKNVEKECKIAFPGYVFIESQESVDNFIRDMQSVLKSIKEAHYFLYYGDDKKDIAMRESERFQIKRLMNAEFCMDSSYGLIEGDRVKITSGALMGTESQIIRINKRKYTAVIEVDMFRVKCQMTLMLELLEKI